MEEIKVLKAKRGQVKAAVTRFKNFLSSFVPEEGSVTEIKGRKDKFLQTWEQFNELQANIELLDSKEVGEKERDDFESNYFELLTMSEDLIVLCESRNPPKRHVNLENIKLPVIELKTFSGNYEEWHSYCQLFTSMIHENSCLNEVQKFHYLRSSLTGGAAEVISSLEITPQNYFEAWELLKERYDNRRLIIHMHLRALFEASAVPKENLLALRKLLDHIKKHLRALKALNSDAIAGNDLLVYLILTKLDPITVKEWQGMWSKESKPTCNDLLEMLTQKCDVLEAVRPSLDSKISTQNHKRQYQGGVSAVALPTATDSKEEEKQQVVHYAMTHKTSSSAGYVTNESCMLCKGHHKLYKCEEFKRLTPSEKYKFIIKSGLCLNCLKPGVHLAKNCFGPACRICAKKHNTLLHASFQASNGKSQQPEANIKSEGEDNKISSNCNIAYGKQAMLSTAVVKVLDSHGKVHEARALLDSGSQSDFITERFAKVLNLEPERVDVSVVGIGQQTVGTLKRTKLSLGSRLNGYSVDIQPYVMGQITEALPVNSFEKNKIKIPADCAMADPNFNLTGEIDLLLGVQIFWDCMLNEKLTERNQPLLQNTKFGWVLGGGWNTDLPSVKNLNCNTAIIDDVGTNLSKFCETQNSTAVKEAREKNKKFKKDKKVQDYDESGDSDYDIGYNKQNKRVFDSDEDSDVEISDNMNADQNQVYEFLSSAGLTEVLCTPNCSQKKAEGIIEQRPFTGWKNMVEKSQEGKNLGTESLNCAQEVLYTRHVVNQLMQKCSRLAVEMERAISAGTSNITVQPQFLSPSLKLASYQIVELNWLIVLHNRGLNGIFADEMGLGKTVQIISFLAHLRESAEDNEDHVNRSPHLRVVPSSTMENWSNELDKWCPSLKVHLYYRLAEERKAMRIQFSQQGIKHLDVILTTYNLITSTLEERKMFKVLPFNYVIFDEAHMLKNMNTQRFENQMRANTKHRILLTGTPLQNNLLDMMSLLTFVISEMLEKKKELKEDIDESSGMSMMMDLRKLSNHPLLLRDIYDDDKLRAIAKILAKERDYKENNVEYIVEDLSVMSDFQSHSLSRSFKSFSKFGLRDEDIIAYGKFPKLDEMLPKLKAENHRVLIFSQFVIMLNVIEEYLKIRDSKYTYEQFHALVIEIEAVLDSRPITPVSKDINDFSCLTPAHFLIGDSLCATLEKRVEIGTINSFIAEAQWDLIQRQKQHFWKRWSTEYLRDCQTRTKWKTDGEAAKEGQLVMVIIEYTPPMKRVLGQITDILRGEDGVPRVVNVRTRDEEFKRGINRIAPLPC